MTTPTATAPRRGAVREFISGIGYLGRGLRMYVSAPRIMWLGVIPAFIVFVVYLGGIIALVLNIESIAEFTTQFASGLDDALRQLIQALVGLALLAVSLLLFVFTFTAVTLAVGDPFYERIWNKTESLIGDPPPEPELSLGTKIGRAIIDTLRLLLLTILVSLGVFVIGLIPLVGTVTGAVLGALFGGWFLTLELTGFAFEARGLRLSDRRHVLGARRARTLGFGVATYLFFLVPFAAVIVMPAAVAGATLLSRDALGESQAVRPPIGA